MCAPDQTLEVILHVVGKGDVFVWTRTMTIRVISCKNKRKLVVLARHEKLVATS